MTALTDFVDDMDKEEASKKASASTSDGKGIADIDWDSMSASGNGAYVPQQEAQEGAASKYQIPTSAASSTLGFLSGAGKGAADTSNELLQGIVNLGSGISRLGVSGVNKLFGSHIKPIDTPNISQSLQSLGVNVPVPGQNYAESNPMSYGTGNLLGGMIPYAAVPELGGDRLAASLFSKLIGKGAARFGGNLAENAGLGALQSSGANQDIGEGAGLGALGALAGHGLGVGGKGANRLMQVGLADADKVQAAASRAYNNLYDRNMDIKFEPSNFRNYLGTKINELNKGSDSAINADLVKDLTGYAEKTYPEAYDSPKQNLNTPYDIHEVMKKLGKEIDSTKDPNERALWTGARSALRDDQVNGFIDAGRPEEATNWLALQRHYGTDVMPLKKHDFSLPELLQGATAGYVGHYIPHAELLAPALGFTMAAKTPLINLGARFGSSYAGGPRSIFKMDPQLARKLASAGVNLPGIINYLGGQ